MAMIMAIIHGILMLGVLALTYEYYGGIDYVIPNVVTYGVYFGVLGVSVVWALCHGIFGGLMGMAGGSVWDGVRLALILGTANSIGRLWPYVFTFSLGAFLNHPEAENWIVVVSFLGGLFCLGVYFFMNFVKNA